ncbi:MAG: hypothetical protein HN366_23630 [Deltaproteobacteria bacterium]|nr:hypothetical protein [Deltaproteobacteria bacterium]
MKIFPIVRKIIGFIQTFRFVKQVCRCLTDINFSSDHVCDQAGVVFVEEFDFAVGMSETCPTAEPPE